MAVKKKQQHKGEPINLPEEEWDFQECPKYEIWDCWLFEYSREFVRQGNVLPNVLLDFFTPDKQFPETPYLKIAPKSRLHGGKPNTLPASKDEEKLGKWLAVWGDYNPIHAIKEDPNWDDIWTIRIDWTLPPKKLTEDFRQFILNVRPKDRKAVENRGINPRGARKSELKKLGAYRLLEAGFSPVQAMEYSVKINGYIPYVAQPDWYKASKDVNRILSDWPPDYLR